MADAPYLIAGVQRGEALFLRVCSTRPLPKTAVFTARIRLVDGATEEATPKRSHSDKVAKALTDTIAHADATTRRRIGRHVQHADFVLPLGPERRIAALTPVVTDDGVEAGEWISDKVSLKHRMPASSELFWEHFTFARGRHSDPETLMHAAADILRADAAGLYDHVRRGYVCNAFVVLTYKVLELRHPGYDALLEDSLERIRGYAEALPDAPSVREDRFHMVLSIETVWWQFLLGRGRLDRFRKAGDALRKAYAASTAFQPAYAFNLSLCYLIQAAFSAQGGEDERANRYLTDLSRLFRRAVDSNPNSVMAFKELEVSYRSALLGLKIRDGLGAPGGLSEGLIDEIVAHGVRVKTPAFANLVKTVLVKRARAPRARASATPALAVTPDRVVAARTPSAKPAAPALLERFRCADILARNAARNAASADSAARGERWLKHDALSLAHFPEVTVGAITDFEANPHKNRSWQSRLNWFNFLPYALSWHLKSGEAEALERAIVSVETWLDRYLATEPMTGGFEFAWHDHGSALRTEQLSLLLHHLLNHAPERAAQDGLADRLVEAIRIHAGHLAREDFYSQHTNHGLEQARLLLTVAHIMGEAFADPAWRPLALERIGSEMAHTFSTEGVHVENSPGYHIFVFRVFTAIIEEFPLETLGDLGQRYAALAPKALDYITRIVRPDGRAPILGDTQMLTVTDGFKGVLGGTPEHRALTYALSRGVEGERPQGLNRVWPKSGYAVFRDRWPDAAAYRDAHHLIFKAGALAQYHRQEDDGHVMLYAHGEDWLIDSGLYNANRDSPIRKYMRSRAAHNVLHIPGRATDPAWKKPGQGWRITDWSDSDTAPGVTATLPFYDGVTHTRSVSGSGGRWRVADEVAITDGQPAAMQLLWHVPRDKRVVRLDPREFEIHSKRTDRILRVRVSGDEPVSVRLSRDQDTRGRIHSLVSYRANEAEPSYVIAVRWPEALALSSVMDFAFETGAAKTAP